MPFAFHYVTVAGAGIKDGAAWATAFDLAAFQTHWDTGGAGLGVAAGDIFFFAGGTYTMTGDIATTQDGTSLLPIAFIGVTAGTTNEGDAITDADFAQGDNRPLFDAGVNAYGITIDDYGRIENIRIETRDTMPLHLDTGGVLRNCKVSQNYTGVSTSYGIQVDYGNAINCEVTGAECTQGIWLTNSTGLYNFIHDITEASSKGIVISNISNCLFNIFYNVPIGIDRTADNNGVYFGNTIDDCNVAYQATTDYGSAIINNIIANCATDGFLWTTAGVNTNIFMNNHFYNNGDDLDGVTAEGDANDLFCDFWATTGDPLFTTTGSDYTLGAGSPCINAGLAMRLGVG